jgi:NAD(P)-dependent dehydrogenase (short-subunit alcohol dehydrogenase family)
MARFDNKVVIVSGGARGQGAAEARLLVAQGAKVVIGPNRFPGKDRLTTGPTSTHWALSSFNC